MKKRILVVDDNEPNRLILRALLEGHGCEVTEAVNGAQALDRARPAPPDAVITDLLMPEMDGYALCREWMRDEALHQIPLIVYTATYTGPKDRKLALDLGAAGFYVKPTEPTELVTAIMQTIADAEKRRAARPELADWDFYARYSERLRAKLDRKIAALARTEQSLAEYVARCEAILDISPSAIVSLDEQMMIRSWNFAAERLLGYSESEVVGRPLALIIPPDRSSEAREMIEKVREFKESVRYETRRIRKDGTPLDVSISLSFLGPEIGVVSMIADLTAERRAAAEKKQLEAQLAQADRLASMGMLAAGVAHEINNPLTQVLYNLESLAADLPELLDAVQRLSLDLAERFGREAVAAVAGPALRRVAAVPLDEVRERFADILQGTSRIRDIARDLGTFSRVEEDQFVAVDLIHVIEVATNMAQNEIKYRARLVKDYANIPDVLASEGRLSQVFLNLLINAAHAIDEGDAEGNEIRVRTWVEGDRVCAAVRDTGTGIPPEHLDRLFEPFFTTKKIGEGSGLGLVISKSIVESYGGTIEVQSEPGEFTCFTVRLPAQARPEDRATQTSAPPEGPPVRGRVLVVDDEARVRAAMARMLRDHDTVQAASGAEARSILEQDRAFDVIVCDLMMSEVSGANLHRWLSETHPDLARRVIFITGGAFTSGARDYLNRVDNILLEKPFRMADLRRHVGELTQKVRSSR